MLEGGGAWEVKNRKSPLRLGQRNLAARSSACRGLRRCSAHLALRGGGGEAEENSSLGKQTLENWMIPCISSQLYDLITRKCRHLSGRTDVWKKGRQVYFFLPGLWVSLIFLEGKASLWPCSHKAGLFARRSLAATQRRMTLAPCPKRSQEAAKQGEE